MRVNLRPLANPLPLGLFSFGIGMLLLGAQSTGWIPLKETRQVGLVLASFVFPLEGLAAIFAFLSRDTLAGTVLGLFTTSWLTLGLALIIGPPGAASLTLGFYLLAFAAAIIALAAIALMGKPLIALLLSLSAARAILDGLYQVSNHTGLEHASGYVALAIAGVAWYAGTAFALEDLRQSSLLPVFRRGAGKTAIESDDAEQLQRATGEAGIRQQL
jgi:succinate-acetate transporter protein